MLFVQKIWTSENVSLKLIFVAYLLKTVLIYLALSSSFDAKKETNLKLISVKITRSYLQNADVSLEPRGSYCKKCCRCNYKSFLQQRNTSIWFTCWWIRVNVVSFLRILLIFFCQELGNCCSRIGRGIKELVRKTQRIVEPDYSRMCVCVCVRVRMCQREW